MYVRVLRTYRLCSLLFLFCCILANTGIAQNAPPSVSLYTPYTKISVPPGQVIDYSVSVINNSNSIRKVDMSLSGLPKGWTYTLKSASWNISQISVLPKKQETVSLQVTVPLKVNKGTYRFHLNAGAASRLALTVVVSQKGTYKTEFSTEQTNMEGAANATFTFNATLRNETVDKQLYALGSVAPPGWNITFKANYKQVSSVNVDANHTENITVDVNPPDQIPAGKYKIPVFATTSASSADLELEVVITGSYDLTLTTPTGLLSTDITAGDERRVELSVRNTGSAPLKDITLSAGAPAKWDVIFDPKKIDALAPGKSAQVFATIEADKDAMAGDYVTSIEARTTEKTSKAEFRVSVKTSMLWGWMGILIILVALGSVYYLFRKYGRR